MHSAIEPFGCSKPHLTFITDPSHRSKTLLAHSKFPSRTKSNLSHPRGNSAERHEVARLLKKQDLFHCVLLAEKITHPDMNLKQDTYIISKLIYIYTYIHTTKQQQQTQTLLIFPGASGKSYCITMPPAKALHSGHAAAERLPA